MRHRIIVSFEITSTPRSSSSSIITRQVYEGRQYRPHTLKSLNKMKFRVTFNTHIHPSSLAHPTTSTRDYQITKVMLKAITKV